MMSKYAELKRKGQTAPADGIFYAFSDEQFADGLVRLLEKHKTLEESQEAMKNDVKFYLKQNPNLDITEEYSDHILVGDEDNGCLWQILEL